MMMEVYDSYLENTWINEPRWSWFGTPMWNVEATILKIKFLEMCTKKSNPTGGLTTADFSARMIIYWIYFTPDEYVLWKLHDFTKNGQINIDKLREGIIYNQ